MWIKGQLRRRQKPFEKFLMKRIRSNSFWFSIPSESEIQITHFSVPNSKGNLWTWKTTTDWGFYSIQFAKNYKFSTEIKTSRFTSWVQKPENRSLCIGVYLVIWNITLLKYLDQSEASENVVPKCNTFFSLSIATLLINHERACIIRNFVGFQL